MRYRVHVLACATIRSREVRTPLSFPDQMFALVIVHDGEEVLERRFKGYL